MEICDFLKSWKRMCNSMTEMNGCEDCPIVKNTHNARCGDMPCEMQDVESITREVEKWAKAHPKPVYPTWREWLEEQGVLDIEYVPRTSSTASTTNKYVHTVRTCPSFYHPIPADIAEKLGIKSKNG